MAINPKSEILESTPLNDLHNFPLVSIITAVYNAENYLPQCIQSVLSQSYKNFEYILIDGGSTDDTVNIIKRYQNQLAYWISEPDKGIYDAWNKGLAVAKGEWIAFVGADDLLYPDALQTYIEHIVSHSRRTELEFVSSRIKLVKADLSLVTYVGAPWAWDQFKLDMITWHVGCLHSKHLFETYGFFNSFYRTSGDYELLLRPKEKLVTSFVDKVTVQMRVGGISNKMLYKAIKETYHAKVQNKVVSPLYGFIFTYVDNIRVFGRQSLNYILSSISKLL